MASWSRTSSRLRTRTGPVIAPPSPRTVSLTRGPSTAPSPSSLPSDDELIDLRDLTLVLEVVGEVHGGHPAFTDLAFDAVAALEGCVQAGDGIWSVQAPCMSTNRQVG